MTTIEARPPVQPGEPAPDFSLPAVHRDGVVSLADYRGRSPVLLVLLRGVWCCFCRRHLAHLGMTRQKLRAAGAETLAVVASPPERARLYFRFHPARVPLAADPELTTHRSYRVSKLAVTPEFQQEFESARINPMGELAEPLPISEAGAELTRRYPFDPSESDREDSQRQFPLPTAQFLIDRGGIVRWANVECAKEGPAGVGAFPTDEELLAVARSVAD